MKKEEVAKLKKSPLEWILFLPSGGILEKLRKGYPESTEKVTIANLFARLSEVSEYWNGAFDFTNNMPDSSGSLQYLQGRLEASEMFLKIKDREFVPKFRDRDRVIRKSDGKRAIAFGDSRKENGNEILLLSSSDGEWIDKVDSYEKVIFEPETPEISTLVEDANAQLMCLEETISHLAKRAAQQDRVAKEVLPPAMPKLKPLVWENGIARCELMNRTFSIDPCLSGETLFYRFEFDGGDYSNHDTYELAKSKAEEHRQRLFNDNIE